MTYAGSVMLVKALIFSLAGTTLLGPSMFGEHGIGEGDWVTDATAVLGISSVGTAAAHVGLYTLARFWWWSVWTGVKDERRTGL